CQQGNTLPRTF
nr:immunoglobulin light chain junction region [Mus musculus]NSL97026.1 immunoglobulin light chain junction region [Mus musculus]NSL97050.1 immunoglobulin light chain junction region [Mus musculus]NSL97059.1 immunoglobulin light chain junction region [Mus musculus]NSL97129.1 immunoglobulin light chain junction region [Mus musculus]